MSSSSCVWILLFIIYGVINKTTQHNAVCEKWNDIFEECGTMTTTQGPIGPPGKQGPTGEVGFPGMKGNTGAPGVPDNRRMEHLQEDIARLERIIRSDYVPRSQLDLCDAFHDGKCYVLITTTARLDIPQSKTECQQIGGVLANIYSREHFEKVVSLIRSRTPIGLTYHHIWTGMTIHIRARTIRLRDSSSAPFTRWFPGRPYVPARYHVGIHVETNSGNQGMFDDHSTYRLLGALCEI